MPFIPFVPLPATGVGVYTMMYFDVPAAVWLLNLAVVCLGTFISLLLLKKPVPQPDINPILVLAVLSLLLVGTFFSSGVMDVHRWININSLQLNVGLMVTPLILIQISRIATRTFALTFSVLVTIVFLLQPDASLVSAFAVSVYVLLVKKPRGRQIGLSFLFFALFVIGYSWHNLDGLEPVRYVETITAMAREISMTLYFVSIISLLLLVVPFVYPYPKNDQLSISLGIYFLISLLAPFFGHFPVMFMGYGISPILGYFIALVWKINTHSSETRKELVLLKKTG
ncbi:hypothetical protein GCM10027454_33770 [Algoriphagus aestuariicola]